MCEYLNFQTSTEKLWSNLGNYLVMQSNLWLKKRPTRNTSWRKLCSHEEAFFTYDLKFLSWQRQVHLPKRLLQWHSLFYVIFNNLFINSSLHLPLSLSSTLNYSLSHDKQEEQYRSPMMLTLKSRALPSSLFCRYSALQSWLTLPAWLVAPAFVAPELKGAVRSVAQYHVPQWLEFASN